jgi:hypothetical protein
MDAVGWLLTVAAGIFAGGALYVSFVEHPARMSLGPRASVAQFADGYPRASRLQGGAAVVAFATGLVAAFGSQWLWLAGGTIVGLSAPWTLLVMLPVNHELIEGSPSEDRATLLLRRWAQLHAVRTILGILGFSLVSLGWIVV